ncbi:acetylcholinesterase-like [Haemaphysalis longicornis]
MEGRKQTFLLVWALLTPLRSASEDVIVTVSQGQLRGRFSTIFGHPINSFTGIPYAEPPVGKRRFLKPEPLNAWSGVYDATESKDSCMQTRRSKNLPIPVPLSEDCLYLSLWTPSTSDSERRAVLVWFYGGIYEVGSMYESMYNATILSALNNVVVVTCDYRMSTFGFFDASDDGSPGNVGLWDQLLVLEWVRDNIAVFGGDSERVTLFGVSSGAMLVHAHVLSSQTKGLFRRVYLMSGTLTTDSQVDSVTESIAKGNKVAVNAYCSNPYQDLTTHTKRVLDCLRNVTASDMASITANTTLPKFFLFMPTYKTEFIPWLPSEASEAGAFPPVDAVVSVTANEGSFPFIFQPDDRLLDPDLERLSMDTLRAAIKSLFRGWLKDKYYPLAVKYLDNAIPEDKVSLRATACDYFGKQNTYCSSRFFVEKHSQAEAKVYAQVFAHRSKKSPLPEWMGVPHMEDVVYTFGIPFIEEGNYTDEDRNFSRQLMKSLVSFAETGEPQVPGGLPWPQFSLENPYFMWLQPGNYGLVNDYYGTACDGWRKFL